MPKQNKPRVTMERTYDGASIDDVWELWTTKAGIESWWGPDGFRVEVRKLDLRAGGELLYAMIAAGPEQIAFMERAGMPTVVESRITYREVRPSTHLSYVHLADFIPGVEPYDVETTLDLQPTATGVRLTLCFDAMHEDLWTQRAVAGWESELDKLAKVLA